MSGGRYDNNIVYQNAGGPLLFNSQQNKNIWQDNLFLKDGKLPPEFIEVMQAITGLEPEYQKSILRHEPIKCQHWVLSDTAYSRGLVAYQFHLPARNSGMYR